MWQSPGWTTGPPEAEEAKAGLETMIRAPLLRAFWLLSKHIGIVAERLAGPWAADARKTPGGYY